MGNVSCGITRIEKRKRDAVYGLELEANRTLEQHIDGLDFNRSDIDWTLTNQNIFLKRTDNWNKEITRQIEEAGIKEISKGKNASVVLLDGLYTASSEWFDTHPKEEWLKFFKDCLDYHIRTYAGSDESRLLNAVIHLDETCPHLQVASIPILDDGIRLRLSAKDIMGGKQDYRKRQDRFYDQVSKKYGLDRGKVVDEGELRLHLTKREWQIATQQERLEEVLKQTEEKKQELDSIQEKIEAQPPTLTPEQIAALSNEEGISRNRKGDIVLPEDVYRSLIATVLQVEVLVDERIIINHEKKKLEMDQLRLESQKEEVLEQARIEGLKQGNASAEDVMLKSSGLDQLKELLKNDVELSLAFRKALTPKAKKYPLLVELLSDVLEWARELCIKIAQSVKMSL